MASTVAGSFYYHERQLQDQKSLYRLKGRLAKKNLIRGLLLALELESANAILKTGIFTSFLTGNLTLAAESANAAISILHEVGQGAQFDSIPFSGSSLAFHNRVGQNFTASYSVGGNLIDATGVPN